MAREPEQYGNRKYFGLHVNEIEKKIVKIIFDILIKVRKLIN